MSAPRPGSWALYRYKTDQFSIGLVQRSSQETVYFTGKTLVKSVQLADVISTYASAGEAEHDRKRLMAGREAA